MDPVTGGLIAAGAGSLLSTVGGLITGNQNYKLGKKQLAWQKEVQRTTWAREDNAVRRRAADLNAAGMNRLLAAGSGAVSSAPVHIDVPDAPDYSHIGDPLIAVAQQRLQMAKQQADISQTEAQTQLLTGQLAGVKKQNELLQRQLDWYKNHPQFAPNVSDSIFSSKGLTQAGERALRKGGLLDRVAGRFGRLYNRAEEWANFYFSN